MELEIVDEGKSNLIKKLLTIGVHWSLRIQMGSGQSGVYHWSPLELEIVDESKINLIKKLPTPSEPIGVHWSSGNIYIISTC